MTNIEDDEWPPEDEAAVPLPNLPSAPPYQQNVQNGPAEAIPDDVVHPIPPPALPLPRPLDSNDVSAFIVNKMIGTGIFTTPVTVLIKTHNNKGLALGLWFLGFIYTLISMTIYLEYARKLPHTGGELIYLDESFKRPRLFAYTIYAFYFIFLYNTATNSMQFASEVMASANPYSNTTLPYSTPDSQRPLTPLYVSYNPDQRVLRFIAIVALTTCCLIHYFSVLAGRTLNKAFALVKICLLLVVIFAGIHWGRTGGRLESWTTNNDLPQISYKSSNSTDSAAAFLLIIFSFTGWENATFVTGEVANHQVLRKGFVRAVLTVGTLYVLVNLVFLLVIPDIEVLRIPGGSFVPEFFGGTREARKAWAVLIAISALANLLAVIYTCCRVKHAIGLSNIIPWSRIWTSLSPVRSPLDEPSPRGGLILHWICSIVLIVVSSAISDVSEAISFPGNLQAYASGWIGAFIAIGFMFFGPDKIPDPAIARKWLVSDDDAQRPIPSVWITAWYIRWLLGLCSLTISMYVIIARLLSWNTEQKWDSANQVLEPAIVQGWLFLATIGPIYLAAILYYFVTIYSNSFTVIRFIGARPVKEENETHDIQYGFKRYVSIRFDKVTTKSYLYWIFGGRDTRHIRLIKISQIWDWVVRRK